MTKSLALIEQMPLKLVNTINRLILTQGSVGFKRPEIVYLYLWTQKIYPYGSFVVKLFGFSFPKMNEVWSSFFLKKRRRQFKTFLNLFCGGNFIFISPQSGRDLIFISPQSGRDFIFIFP